MAKLKRLVEEGDFSVGEHVLVGATHESGIIKFLGSTQFQEGEWVGVALKKPLGKNDGTVQDIKYFECKPRHGIFVRKTALLRPKQAEEVVKCSKEREPTIAGAKALMSGTKSGEVGKIADNMEEQGLPGMLNTTSKERGKSNSASKSKKAAKAGTRPRSKSGSARSSAEMDNQAATALKELRQAAEDHNPDALRKALMVAESRGVPAEELGSAHRILAFESQKVLSDEIAKVRNVIAGLSEVVRQIQTKAKVVEESAKSKNAGYWVNNLVERIEGRVWEGLEKKVDERIESTVRIVAHEMLSTFAKSPVVACDTPNQNGSVRQRNFDDEDRGATTRHFKAKSSRGDSQTTKARRWQYSEEQAAVMIQRWMRRHLAGIKNDPLTMSVRKAKLRHQAWCRAYEEVCAGNSGLDKDAFTKTIEIAIPSRLSLGQRRVLYQGYTQGTGKDLIDMAAFCAIASAIATGDEAAAEYADMNLPTFQLLGEKCADEAASKIGAVVRGRHVRLREHGGG